MAYTITESRRSRRYGTGRSAFAELVYDIIESPPDDPMTDDTEKDALDAVVAAAPTSYQGMAKVGARIEPLDGKSIWRVTVQYGIPIGGGFTEPLAPGGWRVDFPGGTSNELVTLAYAERRYSDGDPAAPNLMGAINVSDSGVEGVQVEVPDFPWTETWVLANADVSWADIIAIGLRRKTTNDAAFRGFAAGEVLFDEFSASPRTEDDWEYKFTFRARANRLNTNTIGGANPDTPLEPGDSGYDSGLDNSLTIGGISNISKGGWEYLWARYREEANSDGTLSSVPRAVYVNQVYLESDFSDLDIGTTALF